MIGRSRGGLSTKIHAIVDAYGYSVFFTLSEGQESDCNHAQEVLSNVDIEGSDVLVDRGYDSHELIDYIYDHGGEPTIPPKRTGKSKDVVIGGSIKSAILLSVFSKN
jgi:transposase